MTTTVTIQVGGAYKADVKIEHKNGQVQSQEVHGDYQGSPNPGGKYSFSLYHPAEAKVSIKEEAVTNDKLA